MDTTTENKKIENNQAITTPKVAGMVSSPIGSGPRPSFKGNFSGPAGANKSFGGGDRQKNSRKSFQGRGERTKPEFDQKILNIRRVTRVTSGGKRLNFSVHVVAGDKKGSVGVGTGKANDTSVAIDKAYRNAKKNMLHLNLTKTMSISHDVSAKYCSGKVMIMPAPGRGVSAGSAARDVLDLAGVKDVTAKILSPSKNKLNIARATIEALKAFDKKRFAIPQMTVEIKKTEIKK